jgi:hypothetical protein
VSLSTEGNWVFGNGERSKVLLGELDEGIVLDGTGSD